MQLSENMEEGVLMLQDTVNKRLVTNINIPQGNMNQTQ